MTEFSDKPILPGKEGDPGKEREIVIPGPAGMEAPKEEIERSPLREPIFADDENKGLFNRLSEGAQEFASGLWERAKMNTVDRAKILYNTTLINWHDARSTPIVRELEGNKSELTAAEQKLKAQEEVTTNLEKEFGAMSPETRRRFLTEKEDLKLRVDSIRGRLDKNNSRLEERNNIKASYENARKDAVESVQGRIKERLEPHESRLNVIKEKRDQLDLETVNFKEKRSALAEQVAKLEERAKGASFASERQFLEEKLGEIRQAMKEGERLLSERLKERRRIERDFAKENRKADVWRLKHNQLSKISQREVYYPEVEPRPEMTPADLSRREVVPPTGATGAAEKRPEPEKGGAVREVSPEGKTFSLENYVSAWNKYFGSELKIQEKDYAKMGAVDKNTEHAFSWLEGFVKVYAKHARSKLSEKDIAKKVQTLRVFINS